MRKVRTESLQLLILGWRSSLWVLLHAICSVSHAAIQHRTTNP